MSKIMKIVASLLIVVMLAGCGQPLIVNEKTYPTYGLFNENTRKSDKMCYEMSVGNVVWSILLFQTIIAPVYFVGWSLYNPVHEKTPDGKCSL